MEDDSTAPFRKLLTKIFFWKRRANGDSAETFHDEVHRLIDAGKEEGLIDEEENELISSIFVFMDTVVREVMTPRTEIVCISDDENLPQLVKLISEKGHSRIPIYHESIDKIKGVIYDLDLFPYWGQDIAGEELLKIARPAYFVPEDMKIIDLLNEFQERHLQFAMIIDEYSGISGLVTVEDILEEIVGEIYDVYDKRKSPNEEIARQADGSVIINGKMEIDEFDELFKVKIERDNFDTISGLLTYLTGKIPQKGEIVSYKNLKFTIESANEKKIKQIKVHLSPAD